MSEYPDYYPEFMRDFHEQKNLYKAFGVYYEMMQIKYEKIHGKGSRVAREYNFMHFMIEASYFIDFLSMSGWKIQKTRKKGKYLNIYDFVRKLKSLDHAMDSLIVPNDDFAMSKDEIIKCVSEFEKAGYLNYMPDNVVTAYKKLIEEQVNEK